MELQLNLKGNKCPKASLRRNDFIYHNNNLYKCTNKGLMVFQNMDNKQSINIDQQQFWKLQILQLVPIKWEVNEQQVKLFGRELGMGPQYNCKVIGFKQFQELNLINRQAARGIKVDYYVELALTKDGTYYILNIQIR